MSPEQTPSNSSTATFLWYARRFTENMTRFESTSKYCSICNITPSANLKIIRLNVSDFYITLHTQQRSLLLSLLRLDNITELDFGNVSFLFSPIIDSFDPIKHFHQRIHFLPWHDYRLSNPPKFFDCLLPLLWQMISERIKVWKDCNSASLCLQNRPKMLTPLSFHLWCKRSLWWQCVHRLN